MLTLNELARLLQIRTTIAILLGNRLPKKLCRFVLTYRRIVARVAVEADKESLLGPYGRVTYSTRIAFISDWSSKDFQTFWQTFDSDRKTAWDE